MTPFKPKLFVGSSGESLPIAYAIQEILEPVANVTVWDQGVFSLSSATLEALVLALDEFDCGAFVFSADDIVTIRDQQHSAARDNVVFELGLFIGRLGRSSAYIVLPRHNEGFRIPTDLLGVTMATYDAVRSDGNLVAALGPACNKIKREVVKIRHRTQLPALLSACKRISAEEDNLFVDVAEKMLESQVESIASGRVQYEILKNPQVLRRSIDIKAGKVNTVSFIDTPADVEMWRGRRMEAYLEYNATIAQRPDVTFARTFVVADGVTKDALGWSGLREVLENHATAGITTRVLRRSATFDPALPSEDIVLVNDKRLHVHARKEEGGARYSTAYLIVDEDDIRDAALRIARLESDAFTWPAHAERIESMFRAN